MFLLKFLFLSFYINLSNGAQPLVMPPSDQKIFNYKFKMYWKMTMAWYNESSGLANLLKYDVDQHKYLVKISDQNQACNATMNVPAYMVNTTDGNGVVTADGKHRRMIMINGQMPGPIVVVNLGSQIVVRLENKLAMEGISIHFHGMDKRNEWFMDGVAPLQQCPITSGSDFVYKFTADTPGTHFYHGHLGTDRVEGVFGAVVVLPKDRSVLLQNQTRIEPYKEFSLILFDWNTVSGTDLWFNHRWRTMKFLEGYENENECWRPTKMIDGTHIGGSYPFSGIILNDKGWYSQDDILNRSYDLDMETFDVEDGQKAYLFRLVNAGQALALLLSVEDHQLQVVSTDGAPVKGVPTDFILIFPGERYDFLLITKEKNQARDLYYMIVETLDYYDFYWNKMNAWYGLAKIRYNPKTVDRRLPDVNHSRCTSNSPCTVVNCPFPAWPEGYNRTCINTEKLEYAGEVDKDVLHQSYEKDDKKFQEFFLNMHYDNVMNGWLFEYPKGPPYFYPDREETVMYPCTENHWRGTRNSWCTYTLNITLGSIVQITLYNTGQGGDMADGFHHPVHLHGTHFYVVKVGYGQYNKTTGILETNNQDVPCTDMKEQCDGLKWANKTWLQGNVPGMNLINPVFKDTVTLPTGGYVVLRFKADNPGWWVAHCHIMVHHMGGMAFALRVGTHEQIPKPPENFPKCGVFDPIYPPSSSAGAINPYTAIIDSMLVFFIWLAWQRSCFIRFL